jgi:hypothetical protein
MAQQNVQTPGPTVTVHDQTDFGVALVSPQDTNFKRQVLQIVPAKVATVALSLKPFVVIVANHAKATIVAYEVAWIVTDTSGRRTRLSIQFKYPDALADSSDVSPEGHPVMVGEKRLVSTDLEIDSSWKDDFYLNQLRSFAKQIKEENAQAKTVDITLDTVIFSDGLLIGPNQGTLDQDFVAYLQAKQDLFRQIVSDLSSGKSVDQAFTPLATLAANHPVSPRQDRTAFYRMLSAQEINRLRRRVGDAKIGETVRRAIRQEPFVLRRNNP